MTKLRFIKAWGPYKPGDIKEAESPVTIHWLVKVYKFAVIEPDTPAKIEPVPVKTEPVPDLNKYIRKPQRDKMVRQATNKSTGE